MYMRSYPSHMLRVEDPFLPRPNALGPTQFWLLSARFLGAVSVIVFENVYTAFQLVVLFTSISQCSSCTCIAV